MIKHLITFRHAYLAALTALVLVANGVAHSDVRGLWAALFVVAFIPVMVILDLKIAATFRR